MNIAIVAGEASGDRYAAELVKALRANSDLADLLSAGENVSYWGIGGVLMREAGVKLIADSSDWGAIGIAEALALTPRVYPALISIQNQLSRRPPKALVLVDFGAFNLRLAKFVKERKICPVFYFMPPGSWRRQSSVKRLAKMAALTDYIVTPFPWSERNLKAAGANVSFVGHPLLDLVVPGHSAEDLDAQLGLDPRKTVVTLLPGSRIHEVKHILPVLFSAAGEIAARVPGSQFLVALAPNLSRKMVTDILRKEQERGGSANLLHVMQQAGGLLRRAANSINIQPVNAGPVLATDLGMSVDANDLESVGKAPIKTIMPSKPTAAPVALVEGRTYDALSRADLVIATSGTVTLEAAILNRPMIIVYIGSKLMEIEGLIRKKSLGIKYIGLPNILADRLVCREMLQDQANPKAIADAAVEMLLQPDRLMRMKSDLASIVRENLGEQGGVARTAQLFVDEILKGDHGSPSTR